MKRFMSILFLVICLFARAENVKVGNIYYSLNKSAKTATVEKGEDEYRGDVIIPETIKYEGADYTVVSIRGFQRESEGIPAFRQCENLLSITIPKTIKSIGNQAFEGCFNLKSVNISDLSSWCVISFNTRYQYMVTHYEPSTNPLYYAHSLFLNGEKITQLTIPDDIFEIKEGSFIGADFSTVIFHKNLKSLSRLAFDECNNIKDVYCYSPKIQYTYHLNDNYYKLAFCSHTFPLDIDATLHIRERYVDNYINNNPELAEWKAFSRVEYIEGIDYHLIYIVDGEEYKNILYEVGETINPISDPESVKEGYTFSGWSEIPKTMPAKDVTVTGSFTINKYKLTYKVDGEVYKSYDIEYGAKITPEPEPTKEGYTFSGWSEIPKTMPAKDVTVTGSFNINKYKLTYMVDGEVYKSYDIEYDAIITPEAEPKKEGYTFSGWSGIPKAMPAKDVIVTGSFTKVAYKLTYIVDGEIYKIVTYDYGATITPEQAPTKEGYTFSGWSEIPKTMPAKDVTVTGSFNINKYKLTYMVDGEVYKSYDIEYDAIITPEAEPKKEGYTFSGWSEIPKTMPAKDITVTGTFSINKYKLVYKVDGKEYKSYDIEYGAKISSEPEPTKEGYTFSGWSEIPKTMPAKNVTVTGTFTINKYKLVYKVDGKEYKSYDVEFGAKITPEPEPTKEGYTFSGWSEIPKTMPAKDITVTGTFSINKYKLVYKVDGKEYKSYDIEYGAKISPEPEPTKEGYTFSGWSEIPKTMPAKDITVTGTFTINKYKLVYMVDGKEYKSYEIKYGSTITPIDEPVKNGYTFSGWSEIPEEMPAHDVVVTGTFTKNAPTDQCEVPTITYKDGKLLVSSKTEGSECVTTITSDDIGTFNDGEIEIKALYNISAYAKAEDYQDSEVVTATLCWIEVNFTETRVNEKNEAMAVLIQCRDGVLYVNGVEPGMTIEVYDIAGKGIAKQRATEGTTIIDTNLKAGDVALVKIGKKTAKVLLR